MQRRAIVGRAQSSLVAQGDETGEEQQVLVQDTDGHRSPTYAAAPVAHAKTLAKK
jgi:hypothetical protein